jgi:DNA-directed RNA polymerase subunit K/omega
MNTPLTIGGDINLEDLQENNKTTMPTFTFKQLGGKPDEVEVQPDNDDIGDVEGEDDDVDDIGEDDEGEDDEGEDVGDIEGEDDEGEGDDIEVEDDVDDIEVEDDNEDEEDFSDIDEDGVNDGDEDGNDDDNDDENKQKKNGNKRTKKAIVQEPEIDYGIESDDEDYIELEKFEGDTREQYLLNFHPETAAVDFDEVRALCTIVRDEDGDIVDPFHTTIPYLTKYEKARILGLRAKQLNNNIRPAIELSDYIIDSYRIAEIELENKVIPFIIKRPLPNGQSEYWYLQDLLQLN